MAVVAEGQRRRHYTAPDSSQLAAAAVPPPPDPPHLELSKHPQYMGAPRYGLETVDALFPPRQLTLVMTLLELLDEVRGAVERDAASHGLDRDAVQYAGAVVTYLAFALDKGLNLWSSAASWMNDREALRETFARQALPITWDFAEPNPWSNSGGSWTTNLDKVVKALAALPASGDARVEQADARTVDIANAVVCTDPPYYDNVPYADLADFFYPWLRTGLMTDYPALLGTVATPKADEMVADSMRLGGKAKGCVVLRGRLPLCLQVRMHCGQCERACCCLLRLQTGGDD